MFDQRCRNINLFMLVLCLSVSVFWFVIVMSPSIRPNVYEDIFMNNSTSGYHDEPVHEEPTTQTTFNMTLRDYIDFLNANISSLCDKNVPTDVIIIIHSAIKHYNRRSTIRQTIGQHKNSFSLSYRLLFIVGSPPNSDYKEMENLQEEIAKNNDILLLNVIDNYRNMTLKALGWLKWTSDYCSNYRYILKTDDDTLVNLAALTKLVKNCEAKNGTSGICHQMSCNVWRKVKPLRGGKNKVTFEEYGYRTYPDFCPGIAYFLPQNVSHKLWKASKHAAFLWLDDVFVTGILRSFTFEKLYSLTELYLDNTDRKLEALKNSKKIFGHFEGKHFSKNFAIIWHSINKI